MAKPVRSLPVVQNWDCSGCSACCRSYHIPVSAEERKRIEGQGWEHEAEFKETAYFARDGSWLSGRSYRLNHRPDGVCVFLGADNRCRIHARFGAAAKPLACRIYPFLLVPAGDHWRLGLRFACPSAAGNLGQPLANHLAEVREYAAALEADSPGIFAAPPTPLQRGQIVPWADLLRIASAIAGILGDVVHPLERRWRKVLGLVALCRGLQFDGGGDAKKMITGGRLTEMLHVLSDAVDEETPPAAEVPRPGWVGRIVFRQMVAVYSRKDHGVEKGPAQHSPLGRIVAAARFALGRGTVPKVNSLIGAIRFAAAEEPAGPLSGDADAALTRYYQMKVESLQFGGPANFDLPFWDGLESLAMTFPAIAWLGRVLTLSGFPREESLVRALRMVDDNFGFNKLLGLGRQKFAVKLLAGRGELSRLIAWYGR
jgi:lysine-N-methylase